MPKSPFTGSKPWILLPEPSPHGPFPITLMADGERIDNNLPYYTRSKAARATRAAIVKLCDAFGTHILCRRKTCRRASACSDEDLTQLPACYHRNREALRHFLFLAAEHRGLYGRDAPNKGRVAAESEPPKPFTGVPLLKRLLDAGAPREVLERETGVTETDWACEREPAALASMAEVRRLRLAREVEAGTRDPEELRKAESEAARLAAAPPWSGKGPPPWRGNRAARSTRDYLTKPRRPSS
jgi:hypothetical protein